MVSRQAVWIEKRLKAGLCRCGRALAKDRARCRRCLKVMREAKRALGSGRKATP